MPTIDTSGLLLNVKCNEDPAAVTGTWQINSPNVDFSKIHPYGFLNHTGEDVGVERVITAGDPYGTSGGTSWRWLDQNRNGICLDFIRPYGPEGAIEFWIKRENQGGTGTPYLWLTSQMIEGAHQGGILLRYFEATTRIHLSMGYPNYEDPGAGIIESLVLQSLSTAVWQHLALSWNQSAGRASLYYDGSRIFQGLGADFEPGNAGEPPYGSQSVVCWGGPMEVSAGGIGNKLVRLKGFMSDLRVYGSEVGGGGLTYPVPTGFLTDYGTLAHIPLNNGLEV